MRTIYKGISFLSPSELHAAQTGERKNGYRAWSEDRVGTGPYLGGKREERGWRLDGFLEGYVGRYREVWGGERGCEVVNVVRWMVAGDAVGGHSQP